MLYAEVFPGQAQVKRAARHDPPRILHVPRAVIVTIVSLERWLAHWQIQRARRSLDVSTGARVSEARIFALRINSSFELVELSVYQVRKRRARREWSR